MNPNARETEAEWLARCTHAAAHPDEGALSPREANVFRLAAMVIRSRFPAEAARLLQASDRYFSQQPGTLLSPADVVRQGWVASLPRLRDILSQRLLRG
jgi:hypothetical protein